MKKIINIFALAFVGLFASTFFTACLTVEENAIDGLGENYVRIKDAENEITVVSFPVVPGTASRTLINFFRDAISESALNQPVNIKLALDNQVITDYNTVHKTAFEPLPTSLYTTDALEFTLGAGEFSKVVKLSLDPTKLDLSKKYAIGVTITDAGGLKIREGKKSAIYQILAENRFDGRYEVTGTMVDFSNATLVGEYPLKWDLVTNGANQVIVYDVDYTGTPTHIIGTASGLSQYGGFGLIVNFKADNTVESIWNFYGSAPNYVSSNGRSAELDPSGENKWDPATKTINIKYWMNQPSVITPHRVSFNEKWAFISKRP